VSYVRQIIDVDNVCCADMLDAVGDDLIEHNERGWYWINHDVGSIRIGGCPFCDADLPTLSDAAIVKAKAEQNADDICHQKMLEKESSRRKTLWLAAIENAMGWRQQT
jgi:hypothetical protein